MNIILLLFHHFLSKTSAAQLDKAGEAIVFKKDLFRLLEFQSAEVNFLTWSKYQRVISVKRVGLFCLIHDFEKIVFLYKRRFA